MSGFQVIGPKLPSEKDATPKLNRMRVSASIEILVLPPEGAQGEEGGGRARGHQSDSRERYHSKSRTSVSGCAMDHDRARTTCTRSHESCPERTLRARGHYTDQASGRRIFSAPLHRLQRRQMALTLGQPSLLSILVGTSNA